MGVLSMSCLPGRGKEWQPGLISRFFYMLVIEDMVTAIAMLPITLGAVAEIHIRMGLVGNTADRASVKRLIITSRRGGNPSGGLFSSIPQIHN